MHTRRLGRTGPATSAIGFGCMGLSQGYGTADDNESANVLRNVASYGVTLFDTAMSYGQGHNEILLGAALREAGLIDRVQLATKFGIVRTDAGVGLDARPEQIAGYCEASLRRLGVDVIDLYYLHRVDPQVPIEDSVGAMAELVTAGKVRHLGVSEVTAEQLSAAAAVHPIAAVQFEWSLMWREPELALIPRARELGVGLVPYSPLGRGLLTATLDDGLVGSSAFRSNDPRFREAALEQNRRQVDGIARLAAELEITPGQLALAWLLAQGDDVVPIPGTRRLDRAQENADAADVVLSPAQLDRLDELAPPDQWVGDRQSFAVPTTARPHQTAVR